MRGVVALLVAALASSAWGAFPLEGFEASPHFGEWTRYEEVHDARVLVNTPGNFDPERPTQVVFYTLPNGNTIEQTMGVQMQGGMDWHYDIQHIAAQIRLLRQIMTDRNLVVVYLEANGRSWPTWRQNHENAGELIHALLEGAFPCETEDCTWVLASHSGGGSFITGFLNSVEAIPDRVKRIVYLDSNYSYDDPEENHGAKLLEWLRRNPEHQLVVVAYDDRNIMLDGQRVVSDTGGTYRATVERMIPRLVSEEELVESEAGEFRRWTGMNGQIDIRVHPNPENIILHTVMVGEMNGLIHAMTVNTPFEEQAPALASPRAYTQYVQASGEASAESH